MEKIPQPYPGVFVVDQTSIDLTGVAVVDLDKTAAVLIFNGGGTMAFEYERVGRKTRAARGRTAPAQNLEAGREIMIELQRAHIDYITSKARVATEGRFADVKRQVAEQWAQVPDAEAPPPIDEAAMSELIECAGCEKKFNRADLASMVGGNGICRRCYYP